MTSTRGAARAEFSWTPLGRRTPTVANLELQVEPGERVLVLGRSGSGKSTLLQALLGALGTTIPGEFAGHVEVSGRVGFVPQNPADAVVADRIGRDVAFGPENLGLARDEIWSRVDDALTAVALPWPRDHATSALSGGERQRLTLAGVLAMQPDLMLLDEPTSMLDAETAGEVRDAVLSVVGDRTLLVVEHRFEPWLEHVDRVVVLDGGKVVSDGPPNPIPSGLGLWLPDTPAPEPMEVPVGLVEPAEAFEVAAEGVSIELVTRTLQGTSRQLALENFSATFGAGLTTAVTGPSGSGKSTVLLGTAGLIRPVAGRFTPDRSRWKSKELAAQLGWVPQAPESGFATHRVRDEVRATATRLGRQVDVEQVLASVGLQEHADSHPMRLSGGEQRRLVLVAALAHRPGLVVADEPTVGQDRDSWALVTGWLAAAARAGATVVAATHDPDLPRDVEVRLDGRFAT